MSAGSAARPTAAVAAALVLAACATGGEPSSVRSGPFQLQQVAKSDIDDVAEVHVEAVIADLRALMTKLYRRNPREWRETGKPSLEWAVAQLFDTDFAWTFPELEDKRGTDLIHLAFEDDYEGDRVLAFVAGLLSMIHASYGGRTEFYVTDTLDPQKLYNSARNVEIAVWKLSNDRDARGAPYLLSNSLADEEPNLSFERLFGKVIARQDAMAKIVAGRTNRTIKHVIQRMLGAVFLPI